MKEQHAGRNVALAAVALACVLGVVAYVASRPGPAAPEPSGTGTGPVAAEKAGDELETVAPPPSPERTAGGEPGLAETPEAPRPEERVVIPWEEAKRFFAGVIPHVDESDRRSFRKKAVEWPDEVDLTGSGFAAHYFNPEGKSLRPEDVEHLKALVDEFDERLKAMADVSFELLAESLQEYFELELFQKSDLPEPGFAKRPLDSGQYNRSMRVKWRGWTCKVDFRSLDFPAFDAHLRAVEALRAERTEAVRAYIRELP